MHLSCANLSHTHATALNWRSMDEHPPTSSHIPCSAAATPFVGSALPWCSTLFINRHLLVRCGAPVKRGLLASRTAKTAETTTRRHFTKGTPLGESNVSFHPSKHSRTFLPETLVCNCCCLPPGAPRLPPSSQSVQSRLSLLSKLWGPPWTSLQFVILCQIVLKRLLEVVSHRANVVDLSLGLILARQAHKHIMTAMNTSRFQLAKDALSGTARRPEVFDSAGGSELVLAVNVARYPHLKSAPDPQTGCASTGLAAHSDF